MADESKSEEWAKGEAETLKRMEAELNARKKVLAGREAAKLAQQANGGKKPQDPEKWIEGVYVDMVIRDDYVLICGEKMERKKWNVDVPTWRMQWEFMRKKLAKRGPMSTANMHGPSGKEQFKKLVEW